MRLIATIIGVALALSTSPSFAQSKDVLVVAQKLNKVENPAEIQRWWKSVINTGEGKLIADAVATFGYPGGGTATIEGIDAIIGPGRGMRAMSIGARFRRRLTTQCVPPLCEIRR